MAFSNKGRTAVPEVMNEETKSRIVTELLYQKSSVSQLWKNKSRSRKAMLLKILRVQDKAAWTLQHAVGVRTEEITDVISYFQRLRMAMQEGEYTPKVDDDTDDWEEQAMLSKGPFEEEVWFHQCVNPKKKDGAKSVSSLKEAERYYDMEESRTRMVDEVGSLAGNSVTADLPTFLENVQQEVYQYREVREPREWSKVEILEKRLERMELDRLQDASEYASSSHMEKLEEKLQSVSDELVEAARRATVEIEKVKRTAANGVEEGIESIEGRLARLEGELEVIRSSSSKSALSCSCANSSESIEGRLARVEGELEAIRTFSSKSASSCSCANSSESVRERLLSRIPKFSGEDVAFPAFKQRFLAYKQQVKDQPSFAYYNDLCTKLEGEALEKVKAFAAQLENSFEAALEKLSRHYGEYEPDEELFTKIATISEISPGSTEEMRDLEDYLRSAIGIYGRQLVRSLVTPIVVKFTYKAKLPWEQEAEFYRKYADDEQSFRLFVMEKIKEEQAEFRKDLCKVNRKVEKNDDGLLEVVLRKRASDVMHPRRVLLSSKMSSARIIVSLAHILTGHGGPEAMRQRMRTKYWTLGETSLAKKIYEECQECRDWRRDAKFEYPGNEVAEDQAAGDPVPFESVGIDLAGPLQNKNGDKRHVLMAVCLRTKAVALELLEHATTSSIEMALLRVKYLRNPIKSIHSDNAAAFVRTSKKGADWKLTSPKAPYQGGLWERAIKTMKRILQPYLEEKWSDEQWRTLLTISESAISQKPLTALIKDPEQVVISPATLVEAYRKIGLDWRDSKRAEDQWKKMCVRWNEELLEEFLREERMSVSGKKPRVGQLVLIKSEKGRASFEKGEIKKLIGSTDGKVRNVEVKLPGDRRKQRALKELIPLN